MPYRFPCLGRHSTTGARIAADHMLVACIWDLPKIDRAHRYSRLTCAEFVTAEDSCGICPHLAAQRESCEEDAMSDEPSDDDLLLTVESLGEAHDRHGAERSDPTGTSAGDDGENRDSSP